MGQAADIALVTQKDSEDDVDTATRHADVPVGRERPPVPPNDDRAPADDAAFDHSVSAEADETDEAPVSYTTPSPSGEAIAPDDVVAPFDETPSSALSLSPGPYRREDAVTVTLPMSVPGEASHTNADWTPLYALAGPPPAEHSDMLDEAPVAPDPPAAPLTAQPAEPHSSDAPPAVVADWTPIDEPAQTEHQTSSFDAETEVPEPPAAPDVPPVFSRGAWDNPPPLAATPPWVWRDVEPDIIPREPADAADAAISAPETEVKISRVDNAPTETSAVVPALQDAPLEPPPASRQTDTQSADQFETPGNPPASAETIPPPDLIAVRQPPRIFRQPEFQTRVEPAWERAPPQTAFQDARPSDFAQPRDVPHHVEAWDRYKAIGRKALRYAGYAVGAYFALVFVLILLYRFVNPPASSLMLVQALTGTEVRQQWVSLDEISPALIRAVIVSEDWSFCEHYGIDIKAIEQAIEKSGDGIPRGASTISMQTTKNLFLWNAKSYIRKAVEVPLTLMIELIWPKWRILEIYLNVAEWGPGIFGAEAAAQYHFNKPASRLDSREAAQLAASLPNPILREAGDPGPRTARKASVIQSRMRNAGGAAACVLGDRR